MDLWAPRMSWSGWMAAKLLKNYAMQFPEVMHESSGKLFWYTWTVADLKLEA